MPKSTAREKKRLLIASEASRKNYGHYPNVIGVGAGIKYVKGRQVEGDLCIHFYVRNKVRRIESKKRLPRFVYARFADGSIDYSRKIRTDVIKFKRLVFARFPCRAGSEIDVIGESGTITLVFRNRAANQIEYYLITCAHVAGDVRRSPPLNPSIFGSCCHRGRPLAVTLVNSTQWRGIVEYDIALARVNQVCTPQIEHQVVGSSTVLRRFLPSTDIRPGMSLDCAFPRSNIIRATVASAFPVSLPLILDGYEYLVKNLFVIDRMPRAGDSGGLLYEGTDAVGILVGMSRTGTEGGWGFFQPLGDAFDYLRNISPVPIRCF